MTEGRRLATFERAMARTQRYSAFNVVIVLRLEGELDRGRLEAALDRAVARHPALRSRVVGSPSRPRFEVDATGSLSLETVERVDSETWRSRAEAELERSLDLARGPLGACTLIGPADGRFEVLLTLAHVIVDGVSGAALVREILSAAAGQDLGEEPVSISEPLPDPETRFPPEHQGFPGRVRAWAALGRQLLDEGSFTLSVRPDPPNPGTGSHHQIDALELSSDETRELLRRARRERVTLNSLLNAATCLAVRNVLLPDARGGGRMRTFTMAGLRPILVPPPGDEALGGAFSMLRLTARVQGGDAPWDVARHVQDLVKEAVVRGDRFTAYRTSDVMMRTLLAARRMRMGEVAVSFTGSDTAVPGRYGNAMRLTNLQVYVSTIDLGPLYVVQARISEGRLAMGMASMSCDLSRGEMGQVTRRLEQILQECAGG